MHNENTLQVFCEPVIHFKSLSLKDREVRKCIHKAKHLVLEITELTGSQ